jgi:hypothetical protein
MMTRGKKSFFFCCHSVKTQKILTSNLNSSIEPPTLEANNQLIMIEFQGDPMKMN